MFTSITLRYIGEAIEPASITSSLGVAPTKHGCSGDLVSSTSGKGRVLKTGFWEWSIKGDSDHSTQLNDQVAKFTDVFGLVYPKLSSQLNCSHSWIDIHIIEENENFPLSFSISNDAMKALSSTGLPIDITVTN
jgi:hypothetical protein